METTQRNTSSSDATISLSGKHVLITGGTHGIGHATVLACLEAGARVTVVARNAEEVAQRAKELTQTYGAGRVNGIAGDVSLGADVSAFFDSAQARLGMVAGVVHAAAILGPIGSITEIDPDAWANVIGINLVGTFLVTREACRRMKAAGGGRIAVFSGGGAASPFPNYTGYAASKAGVVRLAETVAIEMAPFGIEINAIAPGFVVTRIHDQTMAAGALAGANLAKTIDGIRSGGVDASVGANAAAFLISDEAAGITGKFVAAPYDDYRSWLTHRNEIQSLDVFTLRRVVPRERGLNWQ